MGLALQDGDVFAPDSRYGRPAFGESLLDATRTYLGRVTGPMRGRDGNIHRGNVKQGLLPMISHLGAMVSTVNGMLFARRLKGAPMGVGGASIGEGGMNTGALHEAVNQAAIERLPLVLVVADNGYAYSTPSQQSYLCDDLADRAVGYGIAEHRCDGTDFDACRVAVDAAVAAARGGAGPQLVSAKLVRICGHGEHDDATYADPELVASVGDCLAKAVTVLESDGTLNQAQLATYEADVKAAIDAGGDQALSEPIPDPHTETWQCMADPLMSAQRPLLLLLTPEPHRERRL